jgi:Spy/CpxP family protein refolding chaperone
MKRMLIATALGVAAACAAVSASAQPMHDGSPLAMLSAVRSQLNLNTSQQQQWDNAAALSKNAHSAMRTSMEQRHAAMQAELAKSEPDFAALAAANDQARAQLEPLHQQARDAWLALYATFTPEQKGIARDAIKSKMAQMQARRAQHHRGATTSAN